MYEITLNWRCFRGMNTFVFFLWMGSGESGTVLFSPDATNIDTLLGKKMSGKNLVTSEKLVTFPRLIFQIRHFSLTNFEIKRTFMSGTVFPEKSCSLSLGFLKLSAEECAVGVTNP